MDKNNMDETKKDEVCCPKFDPTGWDGKTITWQDKKFVKAKVFTLFYIPLNYGSAMERIDKDVTAVGYKSPDGFCLSDATSMWNTDLYYAVDKEIPGLENTTLSGKYICKVYEGDFSKTGDWMKSFQEFVTSEKLKIKKQYSWYTTCPKCAKKYGKNYVVLFGELVL